MHVPSMQKLKCDLVYPFYLSIMFPLRTTADCVAQTDPEDLSQGSCWMHVKEEWNVESTMRLVCAKTNFEYSR